MKILVLIFIVCLYTIAHAEGSYLVGDLGIIKPSYVLQSKPYVREIPAQEYKTEAVGEVKVEMVEAYWDGEPQSKEAMENAGFYSIVSSKD